MGRVISKQAAIRCDCRIAAGIDPRCGKDSEYPIFSKADSCDAVGDVIVDFSHPSALEGIIGLAIKKNIPLVAATTGLDKSKEALIKEAAEKIAIFRDVNMSVGAALMRRLISTSAEILGEGFDIEIVESHHNKKIDSPSGTALMLAKAVGDHFGEEVEYVFGRSSHHGRNEVRRKNEIGIHSIRGGGIAGSHDVLFCGSDEVLKISHTALSKDVFAAGALKAALFISGKSPGVYNMNHLISGN